jgi:hypothetical protein
MCLVISLIFLALAYTLFQDGNMQGVYINLSISIFFILLMIRNILKTKKEKNK